MAELGPLSLWRRLLALPNDSLAKTLAMACLVGLGSSVIVSVTAVTLRPRQQANARLARDARLAGLIAGIPGMADLLGEHGTGAFQTRVVALDSGAYADHIAPLVFDQRDAAADAQRSVALPRAADTAGLGRRAAHAPVRLLRRDGKLVLVVLPIRGAGYQSMLYGYIALEGDLNTVAGISFYEHGDTPGLGARVTSPEWQAQWRGKRLADATGRLRIAVVSLPAASSHEVDAITGATRTSDGVTRLLRFWLGDHGFGPFLARLRAEEGVR